MFPSTNTLASGPGKVPPPLLRDVWLASELAIARSTTHTTGHGLLDQELPDRGWPRSVLIELLVQQSGIGEMQLLQPILSFLSLSQRVVLVQPPYSPHLMACRTWQMNERNLLWLKPKSSSDALWATEQILKSGNCGAVILWETHIRSESLRRLNLAAQTTDTWCWFMRPISAATTPSPSPLRLALRPNSGGISVDIIKRKGPHCESPLIIPLINMPASRQALETVHEAPVKRTSPAIAIGSTTPELV